MQRGEDHLERRLVLELGMRVDGDAAAVVAHRDGAVGGHLQLDDARLAGHRLVHGVVEKLGNQMMHGGLVGAADIHGGTPAHRLQAFENLDVLGGVLGRGLGRRCEQIRHGGLTGGASTRAANITHMVPILAPGTTYCEAGPAIDARLALSTWAVTTPGAVGLSAA